MSWAAANFHILESRAVVLGVTGRVGGPVSVLDLDARLYLAFIEGVLREVPHHSEVLDDLYTTPPPPLTAAEKRAERRAEIERVRALFGG